MRTIEMDAKAQVMDEVKNALETRAPSRRAVLKPLYRLLATRSLSKHEVFDVIGETFRLSPKFFMTSIYRKIRRRVGRIYGVDEIRAMDKHILKNFVLNQDEQIRYELKGKVRYEPSFSYWFNIKKGDIYVTNHRMIVQGKMYLHIIGPTSDSGQPIKSVKEYVYEVAVCYGYCFPIKGVIHDLTRRKLSYHAKSGERLIKNFGDITINTSKKEDQADKLLAIATEFHEIELFKNINFKKSKKPKKQQKNKNKMSVYIHKIKDYLNGMHYNSCRHFPFFSRRNY
jgi:hypothetical protein